MKPIGDDFTLGIRDAVEATKLIGPQVVIPMHYHAFDLICQDPMEFAGAVKSEGIECVVLSPGETFRLAD